MVYEKSDRDTRVVKEEDNAHQLKIGCQTLKFAYQAMFERKICFANAVFRKKHFGPEVVCDAAKW